MSPEKMNQCAYSLPWCILNLWLSQNLIFDPFSCWWTFRFHFSLSLCYTETCTCFLVETTRSKNVHVSSFSLKSSVFSFSGSHIGIRSNRREGRVYGHWCGYVSRYSWNLLKGSSDCYFLSATESTVISWHLEWMKSSRKVWREMRWPSRRRENDWQGVLRPLSFLLDNDKLFLRVIVPMCTLASSGWLFLMLHTFVSILYHQKF